MENVFEKIQEIPDLKPFGVTHVSSFSSESNLCVKHHLQSASERAPHEVMPERALGNQEASPVLQAAF